jgi:D-3-phosphoglycerate dehydrogenase
VDEKPSLGNAKKVKHLSDLLRKCNNVVLTASKRFGNSILLGSKELKLLPEGAILISLSYDQSIDLLVCKELIEKEKLAGFAIDLVQSENRNLKWKTPNTILSFQKRMGTKQTQMSISEMLSEKLIDFVNTGNTRGSLNFPELNLPALQQSHRFIHIHENKPGVLAQINSILAKYKINISGQYLKTNKSIGYVITDVSKEYSEKVVGDLKAISETIKFRVLY